MGSSIQWIAFLSCFLVFALVLGIRLSLLDFRPSFRDLGGFQSTSHRPQEAAPIQNVNNLYFVTEFALGTPPQSFRGRIQHSPADLFVPSGSCKTEFCANYQRYHSNQSSTASNTTTNVVLEYDSTSATGSIFSDTFTIAGITVTNQAFVETMQPVEASVHWDDHDFDAFLSLSPIGKTTQAGLTTPFSSMINQGVLDVNCFSLKPPHPEIGELGELTFGRTNDHKRLGRRLARIPLTETTIHGMATPWQVELRAVYTANRSTTLTKHSAVIDAGNPFITLPRRAVVPFFRALNPIDYLGYTFSAVDCDRRDSLPDITIDLGGHNFTITAYEYTYESDFHGDGIRCLLAIDDTEEDWSILGASFLKRFYSVFDWDNKNIGLIPLTQFHEK